LGLLAERAAFLERTHVGTSPNDVRDSANIGGRNAIFPGETAIKKTGVFPVLDIDRVIPSRDRLGHFAAPHFSIRGVQEFA
jgi:hypothetical protein